MFFASQLLRLIQTNHGIAELADGRTVSNENHRLVVAVLEEATEEFVLSLLVKRRTDFIE